jgi:hypothetical protein
MLDFIDVWENLVSRSHSRGQRFPHHVFPGFLDTRRSANHRVFDQLVRIGYLLDLCHAIAVTQ